jgi:uncharacterized alpha-E superfamily protein
VLRSLSALQMYHRTLRAPVSPSDALGFLLLDPSFPRSVAHCLREVTGCVMRLPQQEHILPSCQHALDLLAHLPIGQLGTAPQLHQLADDLQLAIAAIDTRITAAWFRADATSDAR